MKIFCFWECEKAGRWKWGNSPASCPAVLLPLGLGASVECGWSEWVQTGDSKGSRDAAVMCESVCPYLQHSKDRKWHYLWRGFSRCIWARGHVRICTCVLERKLHSGSFPVWGFRARRLFASLSPETSGMWDRTRLRQATSLKDPSVWLVSWDVLCSPHALQQGDDSLLLFCRFPVAKGCLKCREEIDPPFPPSFLFFPPLGSPS